MSAAAAAKSLQSCLTLCDPIDGSPPGYPVPGILQARTLKWVAISFSNAWKWKVKVKSLSRVWLLATPWTAAHQAPPSVGFSRREYWSGVPLPWALHILEFLLNVHSFPKEGIFFNTVGWLEALESTWMEAPWRQRHCLSWTLLHLQCRLYRLHLTNTD